MQGLIIVGASDQALVVLDALDRRGQLDRVMAVLDASRDGSFVGRDVGGFRVSGTVADLEEGGFAGCAIVPAIGSAELRRASVELARGLSMELASIIDPTALISRRAAIDEGVFVGPNATVGAGARVGTGSIVNTGSILEHHVSVGSYSHVGPGTVVAGNCSIGDSVNLGVGAMIRDGIVIGNHAVIGAGAVVVKDVPAGTVVAGNPARTLGA